MQKRIFLLRSMISILLLILILPNCYAQKNKLKSGSICTVENGDGKFGIVKILVMDEKMAHVKVYKNKYPNRPTKINIKTLTIGSMYDKDGFGFGHLPLKRKEFNGWKPIQIAIKKVTKEDLEGYEIWKEDH